MVRSIFLSTLLFFSASALAELPAEKIPNIESLPEQYPDSWVFAHDTNFYSLLTGKVIIFDAAADTKEYKGAVDAAQFGSFIESSAKNELYVGETFYSRGTRGDRTDVITIYSKTGLDRIGEIVLPLRKRMQVVTNKYTLQLVDNDKYLLVFSFTPASSVLVIDTDKREIMNEIDVPGCVMAFPSSSRGFSSLCGDGSMTNIQFDEQGQVVEKTKQPPFFSVDDDPLFDKPAYIGKTAYFPSFKSMMQPIDMSTAEPKILEKWSLVNEEEAKSNWRPSGWQIISTSDKGELYVLMQKDGFNGSHKTGGQQVWVYDAKTQQKVREIALQTDGFSIEVTPGEKPLLVVTNVNMGTDVYTAEGTHQRTISLGDAAMPIILHSKR